MPNVLELPEGLLQSNEPLLLYVLPEGQEIKTCLLPSNRADEWAKKARATDDLDFKTSLWGERLRKAIVDINLGALKDAPALEKKAEGFRKHARQVQAQRYEMLKDLLTEYDSVAFSKEVLDKSTTAQIVGAFERLKLYNDPFVVSEALQAERLKATMKELRSPITVETNSPQ